MILFEWILLVQPSRGPGLELLQYRVRMLLGADYDVDMHRANVYGVQVPSTNLAVLSNHAVHEITLLRA